MTNKTQHNKGKIKDNAIKALVRSNIFRHKIEKPKKGAGSYNRQKTKRLDNYSERFVIGVSNIIVLNRYHHLSYFVY